MNKYTFTEKGFTFKRIDKKKARITYNNGLTVRCCPVNIRPGSFLGLGFGYKQAGAKLLRAIV